MVPLRGTRPPVHRSDPHGRLPPVHLALFPPPDPRRVPGLDTSLLPARRRRHIRARSHADPFTDRGAGRRPCLHPLWLCRVAHRQPPLPVFDLCPAAVLRWSRKGNGG